MHTEHLPETLLREATVPAAEGVSKSSRVGTGDEQLKRLVATTTGTQRELAHQLGLSERTLYRRLKALGLA